MLYKLTACQDKILAGKTFLVFSLGFPSLFFFACVAIMTTANLSMLSGFIITVTWLFLLLHTGLQVWYPEYHLFVFLNGRIVTQDSICYFPFPHHPSETGQAVWCVGLSIQCTSGTWKHLASPYVISRMYFLALSPEPQQEFGWILPHFCSTV